MKTIAVILDISIDDAADPEMAADQIFDYLVNADDSDTTMPAVDSFDSYDFKVL
jgi:hypothetical protein